jgi:hypothetical protein
VVSDPFLVGVLFGFVPAMGFLYIVLNNYRHFFDEKRVFKTFFVGMVAGGIVTLMELFFAPARLLEQGFAGVLLVTGLFALLEIMAANVILNWRAFRGRRDTPYYGAALGLGFAGMNTLFIVGGTFEALEQELTEWTDLLIVLLLGLYFMGSILAHSAAFAWIGQGTATGRLVPWSGRALVALWGYLLLLFAGPLLPEGAANGLLVVGLVAAIALIHYVMRNLLDEIVPPEVLREAGIHRRRIARRRMGGRSQDPEDPRSRLEDEAVPDKDGE